MAAMNQIGGYGLRSGLTVAALTGLSFGLVYMIVVGVTVALVSGLPARPPAGAAALAGLAAALFIVLTPVEKRSSRTRGYAASVMFLVLVIFSLGQVFGLPLGEGSIWQLLGLVVFLGVTVQSIWLCVGDAPAGTVRRYDLEKLVIRLLKGQGYIFFTVFVVLPFYVITMT